jgi:hypothetical protein
MWFIYAKDVAFRVIVSMSQLHGLQASARHRDLAERIYGPKMYQIPYALQYETLICQALHDQHWVHHTSRSGAMKLPYCVPHLSCVAACTPSLKDSMLAPRRDYNISSTASSRVFCDILPPAILMLM